MPREVKINLVVSMRTPRVPSFILRAGSAEKFDIADLRDEELTAIGEAWTADLVAHAQLRRDGKTDDAEGQ